MTTERDIEGNVLALVGAVIAGQKSSDAAMRERDDNKRETLRMQNKQNEEVAISSAVMLVTTLLCDIHRIADALDNKSLAP